MASKRIAAALISISPLIACRLIACSSKEAVLPQDGPTMLDIYYGHFEGRPPTPEGKAPEGGTPAGESPRQSREHALEVARGTLAGRDDDRGVDLTGYTRTVETETKAMFPRLPNPEIVLYVYPHLAGPERLPVPGYSTVFPLYEKIEYSLPGETLLPRPPADPARELEPPAGGERSAAFPQISRADGR